MKKIIILVIMCMVVGCGPTIRTIRYATDVSYILDESFSAPTQEYESVFITAQLLGPNNIPKIKMPLYVTYVSALDVLLSKDPKPITEQKEFEANIFNDYTIFDIKINNLSEYDLKMAGYQFLYIGLNNTINATNHYELADKRQLPQSLRYLYDNIMKTYPKTDANKLLKDMLYHYNNWIANNLTLINAMNRNIYSQTVASGLLIFPVSINYATNGHFSIREITSGGSDMVAARSKKTFSYDYKIKPSYTFRKTRLIDGERYQEDWMSISEDQYNNERFNPKKYWYNDTTKTWIEGEVPKEKE